MTASRDIGMAVRFKLKKSAGVKVTAAVHRLILQGNAARDRSDWNTASSAYHAALIADPMLRHIWIQLGNMLKEAGRHDEAFQAYDTAFTMRPDDPEPLSQIAHMRKIQGDPRAAAAYFVRAIRADGTHGGRSAEAIRELRDLLARFYLIDSTILYAAVRADTLTPPSREDASPVLAIARVLDASDGIDEADAAILRSAQAMLARMGQTDVTQRHEDRPGIVFDVTDLLAHFRHHRLPTGIQRVQIEVVSRALHDPALHVRVCCFVDGSETLLDISEELFLELTAMSTSGKDAQAVDWQTILGRVFVHLITAGPFTFRKRDCLVNLGTSWWVHNYFLIVRNAKRDHQISYVPFVHDLIPLTTSEHCVTGVIEDYVSWLIGVFHHADGFLVNSVSTGRDLLKAAGQLGYPTDWNKLEVVPLDADFRRPVDADLSANDLSRWGLTERSYCLIVSTIESRKNHLLALEAWSRLIDRHGSNNVPTLVCVGRSGWLNTPFFERLKRDIRLRDHVMVIEQVSDAELALLYRSCCLTIYPSHYEGWGLPITESLCYGKVPVVADNSSLPEAGGEFALYFQSDSPEALVSVLEQALFTTGLRERLEEVISARFHPRSWASIARQITSMAAAVKPDDERENVPTVTLGVYYPVTFHQGTRIWPGLGSGEVYRIGTGWLWPDRKGSRTTAVGGLMQMRVKELGPFRLHLRLQGLKSVDCAFIVTASGQHVASGRLFAGEERWVSGDVPATEAADLLSVLVRGGSVESIQMMTGGTWKTVSASIGVAGFALLKIDDEAGRLSFIEAAGLESIEEINAYAEPRSSAKALLA